MMLSAKIIWEYGTGIGQINTLIPVAQNLKNRGWKVEFIVPSIKAYIKDIEKLLDTNRLNYSRCPGSPTLVKNIQGNSHASSLLGLSGLQDCSAFTFTLRSWLSVLDEDKPSLVITSSSIGGLMAAKLLAIPTVNIEHGFFSPESSGNLPHFLEQLPNHKRTSVNLETEVKAEKKILNIINNALLKLAAKPVDCLQQVFEANKTLWLNYRQLNPIKHLHQSDFLGKPLTSNGGIKAQWPNSNNRQIKVFVYLYANTPRANQILEALVADPSLNALVHMLGLSRNYAQHFTREHISISHVPFDIEDVLNQADIVICHGGSNLVAESMLKGKPLLLEPTNFLQLLNTHRAVEQGAALQLPETLNMNLIQSYVKKVAKSEFHQVQARQFSYKHQALDIDEIVDQIETIPMSSQPPHWIEKLELQRPAKLAHFADYDVVFLSYDEPNADTNWEQLKKIAPKAKRVHGVKGFDAAHKAAGQAAETERFILVDADNQIDPDFLKISIHVPAHLEHSVWQWCSINHVTGLVYAFGGVKIWTKEVIEEMRTHENCEDNSNPLAIDFWNQPSYQVFHSVHSINYTNGSPFQAFRSGFRETVKLGRLNGNIKTLEQLQRQANNPEIRRMAVWMSAGADIENGYWSLLGARAGFLSYFSDEFSFKIINEYQLVADVWQSIISDMLTDEELKKTNNGKNQCVIDKPALRVKVQEMGDKIRSMISQPPVIDMSATDSIKFKQAMKNNIKPTELFTPVFSSREL
ncbi:glycosyltransferase [Agarivorans aestuarii]|uniref:Glycosyltransferase n=1 Tax=Agarivorans aestuarii TaxID=1563703 RepID=A0ABU7G9V4_9ALTE|nr:glycosyltransferase [Agarivorans aestuarii]MEE1676088.1 glycosyltransferase [Agarivorans aestuarii]